MFLQVPDSFDHAEAHLHAAVGVVLPGLREARHTVVTVSQDLDPQAVVLLHNTQSACRLIHGRGHQQDEEVTCHRPPKALTSYASSTLVSS